MADAKANAAAAKALGNAAFSAKDFEEAIKHFTEAISHDATDHVFFSNRSACFASLEKYDKALDDGKKCVELKPDWPKGYTRKGLAEFWLKKYDDSADTYKAGLKLAPEDAGMKEGLAKAMDAKYNIPGSGSNGGGGGNPFGKFDPSALQAAAAKNPKILEYVQDKELMGKVQAMMQPGQNQQMQQQMLMQMMQQDPRVLEVVMAMQGMDVNSMGPEGGGAEAGEAPFQPSRAAPKPAEKKVEAPPPDLRTPEQKEADEFKGKGNELYKKKQFEEALAEYDKAIAKEPNDITYHNNKCAVWTEMGKTDPACYDKVLETCKDLILRKYEINGANPGGGSFEKVAKLLCRMAVVHEKRKEFVEAIEMYERSLIEDSTRQTRNALRDLKNAKEKFEKEAYISPELAEEHKQKGNDFFKGNKYAEALKEYEEAVKRNPTDAKLYSNRAAALTKLLAYPDAIKDLDECLKLDPTFVKAYSRKGVAHFFMKEYHKALTAYDNGLKLEPSNEECKRGKEQVLAKINESSRGAPDEEQIAHAMADPEIQAILHDPQISQFLKTMQENPKEAQAAMQKDVKLQDAVSKLVAAGIIKTA